MIEPRMWAAHCHIALLSVVMENTSAAKKQLKEALSKAKPGGAQEVLDTIEVDRPMYPPCPPMCPIFVC